MKTEEQDAIVLRIVVALERIANAVDVVKDWEEQTAEQVWDEDDRVPDFLKNPRET